MDDKQFDLLTKSLSAGVSRRSLLRSLAAGLGIAAIGAERTIAAPGVNGKKKCYGAGSQCTNGKQCCSSTCTNRVCTPESGGGGGDTSCQVATDCPGKETECQQRSCDAGVCGITYAPMGTPLVNQTQGECMLEQCDGAGNVVLLPVVAGTPCGPGGGYNCDGNGQCLPPLTCNPYSQQSCYSGDWASIGVGVCAAGVQTCDPMGMGWGPCEGEILPSKELCGNGLDDDCDGVIDNGCSAGMPCQLDSDCGMSSFCATYLCDSGVCSPTYAPAGSALPEEFQTAGDCQLAVCDGFGNTTWVPDDLDIPQYLKPCVIDGCSNGAYSYTYAPAGEICVDFYGKSGQCNGAGSCVAS